MIVPVHIHPSQFPAVVSRQLSQSLATRRLRPKFHYVSHRQAERWLELHRAYSPSRIDPECRTIYESIFRETAAELGGKPVQVIGLGCGGGMKDRQLIRSCLEAECPVRYIPCDVSQALVLTARESVSDSLHPSAIRPLVADLLEAQDLHGFWDIDAPVEEIRVFSFLGMIPNFEPSAILSLLRTWLRPQDRLILSANLIPGESGPDELASILPQYDNRLTRRWLMTALDDLDVSPDRYTITFSVERAPDYPSLKRIVAAALFSKTTDIVYEGQCYSFQPEDSFELFFSNRYRPAQLEEQGRSCGLEFLKRHLESSGEEGVWLASPQNTAD